LIFLHVGQLGTFIYLVAGHVTRLSFVANGLFDLVAEFFPLCLFLGVLWPR
jgi:hypothetical protein